MDAERVARATDHLAYADLVALHRAVLERSDPTVLPFWDSVRVLFDRNGRYGPGTAVSTDTQIALGGRVIDRRNESRR